MAASLGVNMPWLFALVFASGVALAAFAGAIAAPISSVFPGMGRAGLALLVGSRGLLGLQAVALGGLLALLRGNLVVELSALGLDGGLAGLGLGLLLGTAGLGLLLAGLELGVRGRLLKAALAGEVVAAQQIAGSGLGLADELAGHAAGGALRRVGVRHCGLLGGR
jgi:hypothetical protein